MKVNKLDQVHIPDPVAQQFCVYQKKIDDLQKQIDELKGETKK